VNAEHEMRTVEAGDESLKLTKTGRRTEEVNQGTNGSSLPLTDVRRGLVHEYIQVEALRYALGTYRRSACT